MRVEIVEKGFYVNLVYLQQLLLWWVPPYTLFCKVFKFLEINFISRKWFENDNKLTQGSWCRASGANWHLQKWCLGRRKPHQWFPISSWCTWVAGYLVLFKGLHTIFEVKQLEGFLFHPHFQYLSQSVILYFFDQFFLVCWEGRRITRVLLARFFRDNPLGDVWVKKTWEGRALLLNVWEITLVGWRTIVVHLCYFIFRNNDPYSQL